MGLTIRIEADKEGFVGHLREQAAGHAGAAKSMSGADKARQGGMAEGLERAAMEVERWQLPGAQAWAQLRANVTADLDKARSGGDLSDPRTYALADALQGVLARMDALES
jgi:hypothetical protein